MHNRSKIKAILSLSFAFFLTLLFLIFNLSMGLSFGLFNDKSITKAMNESNYYNAVHKALNSYSEELVTEAGLPVSILEEVFTTQRLYIAGKNYVEQVLRGEESDTKTDKLQKKFSENLEHYLDQEKILETEELQNGTSDLITKLEVEYKAAVSLPFARYFTEYKRQYNTFLRILLPIIIVFISVICYFVIRIHRYRHRGLRYIVYALMAASLLTIVAAVYLLLTKQYTGAVITPDYYKNFLQEYLRWSVTVFLYIGGIGLTISVGLISLISYLKNGIKNN